MDAKTLKAIAEAWQEVTEKKAKLDPVDKDELKGKHDDRDDKDIDNDGDVDSSDQYLHKKRKAIGKSMKNDKSSDDMAEGSEEMTMCPKCDGSTDNHDPDCPHAEASEKKKAAAEKTEDLDAKEVGKALSHDCAKHVASESWGYGETISGQHTIVESATGEGVVTHYDVMFEHGIEMDVPVEALTVLVSEKHLHAAKTKLKASCNKEEAEVEEAKQGLYFNINKKKEKGEKPNPKGHPDRPSDDDFKQAAKTAKESVEAGRKAARQGIKYSQNPHKKGSDEHLAWSDGHNQGRTTHKSKPTRRSASAGAPRESVEEGTVSELDQEVETTYKGKGDALYDAIQQVWEAAVQAKQGVAGKHQEKQKGDPQRHGQSQKMISDNDFDSPEVAADFKVGTDDVSKAGRVVTKQSPARGGADQLNVGDSKPVKGAK